ncbi:MAG TPA: hypothetical protein VFU07_00155 [Candidatus Lumbricidophila sp.]|nr:hypothetical protein [Candidatus Lumbricidophila sp.]
MFAGLQGWHILIILLVLLAMALAVVGTVVVIVRVATLRRRPTTSQRIDHLNALRQTGKITEFEYASKREALLREL